jgi:hypothetical protein
MEIKLTSSNDQRPSNEIVKQWWPAAYDEFNANPDADSHYIWVVACLLYSAREAASIIEKAEELLYLCQNYRIPCEGDSFDRYEEYIINPMFPEIKGKRYISGLTAKLSKETVSKYLHDYREWPLAHNVPLSRWWKQTQHEESSPIIERSQGNLDKRTDGISNADIDPRDLAKEEFIVFTKLILKQYPNSKTADLRKNFFEDMRDLNSRDTKIINDLLISAGGVLSKVGDKSYPIQHENKYPKAQWERVFKKIK